MGNEMGNNNTSGFQEENNTAAEAPEKSLQDAGHTDDVKGETPVILPAESEEHHEKITSSASDDNKVGDTQVGGKKSGEREQETEVHPPSNGHATNGTEEALQDPLQHGDLCITHSAESELSQNKIEDPASDDPKMAKDVHGEREQNGAEVGVPERSLQEVVHVENVKSENHVPPTDSEVHNEEVVSSTSDDPTEVGDDNLVLPERDQKEIEVHLPSISNTADTSLEEVVLANDLKPDNNINLPTETKTYLEKGVSLTTDDPNKIGDTYVDSQKAEEKGQEESKLQPPINSSSTDASEKPMQVLVHDEDVKDALPNVIVDEHCASSSYADPKVVGDDPVDEQKSGKGDKRETQVHLPTSSYEFDATEISIQDSLHKDDVKQSNEEGANLASDQSMEEGDPCVHSKTSDQETEFLEVSVKSNVGNAEEKGVQSPCLPIGLEDCKETREFQLEKQTSINTAEEQEITAPEPLKSKDLESDQHESPEILADPSIQEGGESPHGSNIITELTCQSEENGHLLQTDIANNQSASVAPNSTLGVEEKRNVLPINEMPSQEEMNLERNDSSESLPEVKCMVLTEETKLAGTESADEEIKNEHSMAELDEICVNESKIKALDASEIDSTVIVSNQDINEEPKFTLNDCQGDMLEAPQEVHKDSEGEAAVAQNETYASNTSQSPETPQDHKQDTVIVSDNAENNIDPLLKMKQESVNNDADLTAKTLVSAVELAFAKPVRDLPPLAARSAPSVAEIKANGHCAKDETSRFSCGSSGGQSVGRSSTESNPESLSIHSQMRKSPSFNLDLLIEARKEETEPTPELYQDKATTEQSEVSHVHNGNGQDLLQFHAMPAEERVVTLETSDSEKSRASFLGFLKDEEEANIVITPQGQEKENRIACPRKANYSKVASKDVGSSSAKAKGKRKPRPFLFGTCMCCAAVIN